MKYFTLVFYIMSVTVGAVELGSADPTALRLDALEETVRYQKLDLDEMRQEITSIRNLHTATGSTPLDDCIEVIGKKITIKCRMKITKPTFIKNDLSVDNGNVYITNGKDDISTLNGKGNLIVGMKEIDQNGSHNVVIGHTNTFSSYGGLVVGYGNTISGAYASVTGGHSNTAHNDYSSVTGGYGNQAWGKGSAISAGYSGVAGFDYSSISGGHSNKVYGKYSSISGGYCNMINGASYSSITGGKGNSANATGSVLIGGIAHRISDDWSVAGFTERPV